MYHLIAITGFVGIAFMLMLVSPMPKADLVVLEGFTVIWASCLPYYWRKR